MITIARCTEITEVGRQQLNDLMKELRSDASATPDTSLEDMKIIVNDKNIVVVTVNDEDRIVGVASLYVLPKIGKRVAHVEDVVVSSEYRGQGLGEKLVSKTIELARELGVVSISLTSRPSRVAANKLYQKLGFVQKETNPYTLKL